MKRNIIFLIVGCFIIELSFYSYAAQWQDVNFSRPVYLYAGSIPKGIRRSLFKCYIGLALDKRDKLDIYHDIRNPLPLPDNCVDRYQAEDVFEHIEYEELVSVLDEIYRVLKPGGLFRLSVPDYRCDILYNRSLKDSLGNILFDPEGKGRYENGKVVGGGHVWFPTIESVCKLFEASKFFSRSIIHYLHYYDTNGKSITGRIDYSKGHIQRTPDHDKRVRNPYRAMSIVVDAYKKE